MEKQQLKARASGIKKELKELIQQGKNTEALQLFNKNIDLLQVDIEMFSIAAVIFISQMKLEEATEVILSGLKLDPENFDLLFNLGYVHELKGELFHAWNLFRQAEYSAETASQKRDLEIVIGELNKKFSYGTVFEEDKFLIEIIGGKQRFPLAYKLDHLRERKKLLDVIMENILEGVNSIVEIEYGPGIISRTLARCGFYVQSFDSKTLNFLGALGLEMGEKLRQRDRLDLHPFTKFEINGGNADKLNPVDMVLLLPETFKWYKNKGSKNSLKIIKILATKAKKQIFINLPLSSEDDKELFKKLKIEIKNLLQEMGWKENGVGRDLGENQIFNFGKVSLNRVQPETLIPRGLDVIYSQSELLQIPLKKCVDINGFTFAPGDWQPFAATIREHLEDPELEYQGSILEKFFQKFAPKNRQEQWAPHLDQEIYPANKGWVGLPWIRVLEKTTSIAKKFETELTRNRGGNQHFGPNSQKFGQEEIGRIIKAYQHMEKGYQPELFPDGYINGYFLKKDYDYRLIVTEGQHRAAALSVLGYKEITAKLSSDSRHMKVVDYNNVEFWPGVKSGLFSPEDAKTLFNVFFYADGCWKAEYLGII